jgi:small-conductance mechanosensitive channel
LPSRAVQLIVLVATLWAASVAGVVAQPQRPFGTILAEWSRTIDQASQELGRGEIAPERSARLIERLDQIGDEAAQIQDNARDQLDPLYGQLRALGVVPSEGEAPEPAAIATQRSQLQDTIATFEARVRQTELTITRAQELEDRLKSAVREQALERLLKDFPSPYIPANFLKALPEFLQQLALVAASPLLWWQEFGLDNRQKGHLYGTGLILVATFLIGWLLRHYLLKWCGHDPANSEPTYARRLLAAIAVGLARGIVPALIFGAILYRITSESALIHGLFADVMVALFGVLILGAGFAGLAPDAAVGQELTQDRPRRRHAGRGLRDRPLHPPGDQEPGFFRGADLELRLRLQHHRGGLDPGPPARQAVAGEARGRRAGRDARRGRAPAQAAPRLDRDPPGHRPGRRGRGRSGGGRLRQSERLSDQPHDGQRETVGVWLRSDFMRSILDVRYSARNVLKFWLRGLLDVLVFGAGLFLLLSAWGVPVEDMWFWIERALTGVTIGNVTLSISDIVMAIAVFVIALVATRMIQRALGDKVLPQTRLDAGVRHSLTAGVWYLGLIVASVLAISVMGLELSNLAIVAGALSVGIGFGLQGVVNNFVSGFILLIERPFKVGDWIVAGTNQGFVKKIQLRSTEIETFQRASVIIPNADLLSSALVNWTHKDRYGRVDVPIGVAYGSDVPLVMEILERCLKDNSDILNWPTPQVLFRAFGESSLDFEARGFIANIETIYQVQSALLVAIDQAFRDADIEIPFPQRDVHLKGVEGLLGARKSDGEA